MVHKLDHDLAARPHGYPALSFRQRATPTRVPDGVPTGPMEGLVGETYFMLFTFTDLSFSSSSFNAILKIRLQAHFEGPELTGTFLWSVLFDLNIHVTPSRYSEFVSYSEAQRQAV